MAGGVRPGKIEAALALGAAYPNLPPCSPCRDWWYQDDGTIRRDRRTNLPLARPGNPPCHRCPRWVGGDPAVPRNERWRRPEGATDLTPRMARWIEWYEQGAAVNDWGRLTPDHRRWAAAIKRGFDEVRRIVSSRDTRAAVAAGIVAGIRQSRGG